MTGDAIPAGVADFIQRNVESVTQLEVLLLAFEQSDHEWAASEVSGRLANNEAAIESHLKRLRSLNLLTARQVGGATLYKYQDSDAYKNVRLKEVNDCYRQWRTRVIELIFTRKDRQLQSFSDAFRLKEREHDNG